MATGRLYAKQTASDDGVNLDFYFTRKSYSREKLLELIANANRLGDRNPKFAQKSIHIDDENVAIKGATPGKRIKYFMTKSERSDQVELEYLSDLNRQLTAAGMSLKTPMKVKIGSKVIENVGGFIKNPDTLATSDFVPVSAAREVINDFGISHKTENFESYKNIVSLENRDAEAFMAAALQKWRIDILYSKDGPTRSKAGFYRPLKKRPSRRRDLVYGTSKNDSRYIAIGRFTVKKQSDEVLEITAENLYEQPQIPADKYEPQFHTRFGSHGTIIQFTSKDISLLNLLNTPEGFESRDQYLRSIGLTNIKFYKIFGVSVITGAQLSVRIMVKPKFRIPKSAKQI